MRRLFPCFGQRSRAVDGVRVRPAYERFFAVEEDDLQALVFFNAVEAAVPDAFGFHGGPFLRQRRVDAPRGVEEHGAGCGAVGRADETRGREFAVVVRYQCQAADLSWFCPWRVAAGDHVDEGDLLVPGKWCRGCGVLEFKLPFRQRCFEDVG